tara:strand:+ start:3295 stop:4452 length:1158 start_codon:yes stop_codon:yes gene_type:complete
MNITNLHEPILEKKDFISLKKCFESGWISSGGPYEEKFENLLKNKIKAKYISAVINCTSALQISLNLAGVKSNHEVLVPTITFVSTINAVLYNNADPLFMDVDNYFNLDEKKTIEFINNETFFKNGRSYNKKTKKIISAVVVVHTFGNAAQIDKLYSLCKKKKIQIIEDAAGSLGAKYKKGNFKSKYTGTIGLIGCVSFNGNKIITSGGGGAIITSNKNILKKFKHLINQSKVDTINFIHDQIGFNMRISNLHASIGFSQLKKLEKFILRKKKIHELYSEKINKINGLKILPVPDYCKSNYWLNILEFDPKIYKLKKKQIIKKLKQNKINVRSIWYPNHLQKPFKKYNSFKITRALKKVNNSICLPSSVNLNKKIINKIYKLLNV